MRTNQVEKSHSAFAFVFKVFISCPSFDSLVFNAALWQVRSIDVTAEQPDGESAGQKDDHDVSSPSLAERSSRARARFDSVLARDALPRVERSGRAQP